MGSASTSLPWCTAGSLPPLLVVRGWQWSGLDGGCQMGPECCFTGSLVSSELDELETQSLAQKTPAWVGVFIDLLIYGLIDWYITITSSPNVFISSSHSLPRHWNSHFIYNINISLFFQGTVHLFSPALLWRTLLPFFHSPTFFFLSSILHLSSSSPSSSSSSSTSSSLFLVILLLHHLFFLRNLRQLSSITHRTGWRYYIVPRFSPVFCSYSPLSLLSSPPPSSQ